MGSDQQPGEDLNVDDDGQCPLGVVMMEMIVTNMQTTGPHALSKTVLFLRTPSTGSDLLDPCISPTENKILKD